MKYLLALVFYFVYSSALAVSMTQDNCSWDKPGVNPYKGNIDNAVDYYFDIPKRTREILKARIHAHEESDIVSITKYDISGKYRYGPVIEEMHFGPNLVCTNVTRTRWPETTIQKASVYCEDKHCILVPFICGNFSRIKKADNMIILPKIFQYPFNKGNKPEATKPTPIPEPGSLLLVLLGLVSLVFVNRKAK